MIECEENNLSYNGIGNRFKRSVSISEKSCSKSNENDENIQLNDDITVCVDANGIIRMEEEVWEHQNRDKCAQCSCKVRYVKCAYLIYLLNIYIFFQDSRIVCKLIQCHQ